ncbi:MAG: hypothetical protein Q8J78_16600 [Moraxellaceae bacterium]|nr:hypothetical protein [Moraxellaceae bacterium]
MLTAEVREKLSIACMSLSSELTQRLLSISDIGADDPLRYAMSLFYPRNKSTLTCDRKFEIETIKATEPLRTQALMCSPWGLLSGRGLHKTLSLEVYKNAWPALDNQLVERCQDIRQSNVSSVYSRAERLIVSDFLPSVKADKKISDAVKFRMGFLGNGNVINSGGWMEFVSSAIVHLFPFLELRSDLSGRRYTRFVCGINEALFLGLQVDFREVRSALDQGLVAYVDLSLVLFERCQEVKKTSRINWSAADTDSWITMWELSALIYPFRLEFSLDASRNGEKEFLFFRLWLASKIMSPIVELMRDKIKDSVVTNS